MHRFKTDLTEAEGSVALYAYVTDKLIAVFFLRFVVSSEGLALLLEMVTTPALKYLEMCSLHLAFNVSQEPPSWH